MAPDPHHDEIKARVDRDLRSRWLVALATLLSVMMILVAVLYIPSSWLATRSAFAKYLLFAPGALGLLAMLWGAFALRRRRRRALADLGTGFERYEHEMRKRAQNLLPIAGGLILLTCLIDVAGSIASGEWRHVTLNRSILMFLTLLSASLLLFRRKNTE